MIYNDGRAGFLKVVFGPMFSEKSGELLNECLKAKEYQNKKVLILKPIIDTRFIVNKVISRVGLSMEATCIEVEIKNKVKSLLYEHHMYEYDIIGIDEAQFFDEGIVELIDLLVRAKKHVIVAGLNLDSFGNSFGEMAKIMIQADELVQKYACCANCGRPATFTQRICNGSPVVKDVAIVQIGDVESYEPRCRLCFTKN